MTKPTISFEFFPAKTSDGHESLLKTGEILSKLNPLYLTVTYGAGGSTREGTVKTILDMRKKTSAPIAAHLTFINTPIDDLKSYADDLWDQGIHHIIALRGDMPSDLQWPLDPDKDYFQFTSNFVEALKSWHDFEVTVGAYPEKHPDSPSLALDMIALQKKCEAGADRAISQFFFDNQVFLTFAEVCKHMLIAAPIVPGLLPIHDFQSMRAFAEKCNTTVPPWLHARFENCSKPKQTAIDTLYEQAKDLIDHGVPHLHFYTLNKADIVYDVCKKLGY